MPSPSTIHSRPGSQIDPRDRSAGLIFVHNYIRSQLPLSSWLLFGALLQSILFVTLPYSPARIAFPTWLLAGLALARFISNASQYDGRKPQSGSSARSIDTKTSALIDRDKEKHGDGGVCVLLLGFRIHHPLGMLAPGAREVAVHFRRMAVDLEANAEHFGFRGAKSYFSAGDSPSSSELVNVFYFQDYETCHRFAHSKTHMDAVTWWNATVQQYPHLGLMHELYDAPAGNWESIYINYERSGLAACTYPITEYNEKGDPSTRWMDTLTVVQGSGKYQTSIERMRGVGG